MNKSQLVLLFLLVLICTQSFSQAKDSLPVKHNIKLKLLLNYRGFFSERFAAGVQYEKLLNAKNSVSLGISYYGSGKPFSDSHSTIENYKQIMVLPQWRHYFRRNRENYFNGFHLGASSVYLRDYIDRPDVQEKRHVIGLGILAGYQQVIKKRVSLGITPSLHFGVENTNYNRYRIHRRFFTTFIYSLDFHIGYIF